MTVSGATAQALVLVALATALSPRVAAEPAEPAIDNARVTVWNLTAARPQRPSSKRPCVSIRLTPLGASVGAASRTPGDVDARVAFFARCSADASQLASAGTVVIELKDAAVAPLRNTSGFPNAFPRPGVKKTLDNDRVVVWDYTWTAGVPTPMHFHDKDVVVVYLDRGALKSTTPDGKSIVNDLSPGLIRFNDRNRVHTEELVNGMARAIIVELK